MPFLPEHDRADNAHRDPTGQACSRTASRFHVLFVAVAVVVVNVVVAAGVAAADPWDWEPDSMF